MASSKTDHIVKASKEIGQTFTETAGILNGMNQRLQEVNQLYDHGYGGAGNSLISLGITLVMFPEPFMVSDVIGGGIIAAGFLYNRAVPPPMYVDDIFKTIEEQVKTIHQGSEGLSRDFTIPLNFSAMHFNF